HFERFHCSCPSGSRAPISFYSIAVNVNTQSDTRSERNLFSESESFPDSLGAFTEKPLVDIAFRWLDDLCVGQFCVNLLRELLAPVDRGALVVLLLEMIVVVGADDDPWDVCEAAVHVFFP